MRELRSITILTVTGCLLALGLFINPACGEEDPSSSGVEQPSFTLQDLRKFSQGPQAQPPAPPAHQEQPSVIERPAKEKLSQFEQYISANPVEITEEQLNVIDQLQLVVFQHTEEDLPPDKVAVAVKIVKAGGDAGAAPVIKDAGYLIGTLDSIATAFRMVGIKSPNVVSTDIRQFGYDLFSLPPSTFAPVDNVPVGPDYVLGPGDEMRMSVWGKFNAEYYAVIDRDGKINVPQMGVMYISGLTYKEARDYLMNEFSRYYIPSEVKVNISMGRLRTIKVFVLGNVQMPGSYTVSSLSTLINALFAAGGPSKEGSMRDIRLNREGKTVVHFDLYDFLLKGDKTNDVKLMPEDVVFVPPVGQLVGLAGNVKLPAIYELKGETRVMDLIGEAGGTTGTAYNSRLQLLRIRDGKEQVKAEMDLSEIVKGSDGDFPLKDGDLVTIFPVPNIVENTVRVSGAVKSPGAFGLRPGMKISELITYAGGLLRYSDRESAELTRIDITQSGPRTERVVVNLQKALSGDPANDLTLKGDDYLFVRTVPEWELYRVVTIKGEVLYPGTYTIKKGETMSSLIERAGGFTDKAYLKGAVFTRESVRESQQKVLDDLTDRLEQQLLSGSAQSIQTSLTGEAAQQEKAAAEQRKAFIEKLKSLKAKGRMSIRLAGLAEFKGGPYDIPLEKDDELSIPEKPNSVQVVGSVYNQTSFVYVPDATVGAYLKMAGGMTKDADEGELYILKVDGTAVSRRESGGILSMHYDPENHRWANGTFMSRKLDPGDTIVVPVETEKIAWLREVKDITQIMFQVAVSAGVVLAAF